ncbi:MAG: histidinol-phosphate aminotransferase family protein [Phycisphaerae bacterium]|nr:histidinol-phosphate aminotransferase family protein [Phycisphaerae bacterium]
MTTLAPSGVAIHAAIASRGAYSVPRAPGPIDLHLEANEGSVSWEGLEDCIRESRALRRYPSAVELEAALAAKFSLSPSQVIVTAGGDDALDRACRMTLSPVRSLLLPEPSFEMFRRYAELAHAPVNSVPWPAGPFPRDAVLRAITPATGVVAIVSPNNPTGAVATREDLDAVGAAARAAPRAAIVILDAAYAEFAEIDLTAAALRHRNAIVVRTFSKAWGLAGLRVGYAIGPEDLIACLRVAAGPYPVSGLSLAIALRVLERGERSMREQADLVKTNRDSLARSLSRLGLAAEPSQANFILARSPRAAEIHAALAARGIAVRCWTNRPGLADALRVTIPADAADLARLTAALESNLNPGAIP